MSNTLPQFTESFCLYACICDVLSLSLSPSLPPSLPLSLSLSRSLYPPASAYVRMYVCIYIHTSVYIYIYIERERDASLYSFTHSQRYAHSQACKCWPDVVSDLWTTTCLYPCGVSLDLKPRLCRLGFLTQDEPKAVASDPALCRQCHRKAWATATLTTI